MTTAGAHEPIGGRRDIVDRADCERLVRGFYGRALEDPVIGWIFVDVARLDLETHVPVITAFWETMLLGARTYAGQAFAVHARLHAIAPLRTEHFRRWLSLWETTVDELFVGERAELAKAHALRVARAFDRRLNGPPSSTHAVAGREAGTRWPPGTPDA